VQTTAVFGGKKRSCGNGVDGENPWGLESPFWYQVDNKEDSLYRRSPLSRWETAQMEVFFVSLMEVWNEATRVTHEYCSENSIGSEALFFIEDSAYQQKNPEKNLHNYFFICYINFNFKQASKPIQSQTNSIFPRQSVPSLIRTA